MVQVLIVEPHADLAQELLRAFDAIQIETVWVKDAASAISAVSLGDMELAIVSYEVAGGGFPLSAQLKRAAQDRGRDIGLMCVTSKDGDMLRAGAKSLGIIEVFQRPISLTTLKGSMDAFVAKRLATRDPH